MGILLCGGGHDECENRADLARVLVVALLATRVYQGRGKAESRVIGEPSRRALSRRGWLPAASGLYLKTSSPMTDTMFHLHLVP